MTVTGTKKNQLIPRNLPLIVAFLAPIVILLLIYIMREIFPFGDEMYLRSDMYHQYAPFLKLFQTILKSGGSLHYSFEVGLGTNFMSTYAYYLASPLNWIVAILPSDHIPEIMSAYIFLKSGLMSLTFAWYLRRRFGKNTMLLAAFGTFYAMSGYMAAYSWNIMWLDCLVLLPLMLSGLERLVKEKKVVLYTVTFALSVISNYYIAIMLCIFSFLYVLYLIIAEGVPVHKNTGLLNDKTESVYDPDSEPAFASDYTDLHESSAGSGNADKNDLYDGDHNTSDRAVDAKSRFKEGIKSFGRYFLYTFLGGMMGAVIFLPALLTLFGTASAGSAFPNKLTAYFNLLELFAHGTINAKVTMMNGYLPNIYAGMAVFALLPLFWLNRKISVRERAGKTALLAILLFSFSFNIPAFIWHGFHFPNSLPSRQSFIYVFLILAVSYEALLKIRELSSKAVIVSFGIAVAAVFALQVLYDSEDYPTSVAWIGAGFLLLYLIFILFYRSRKTALRLFGTALLVIVFLVEAAVNTESTGYGTTSRVSYTEDNNAITYVLNEIEDEDFYRTEKLQRRTKNDGSWSDYRSASVFSSASTAALSDFYKAFGLQYGTNSFSWYGNTPLTTALLDVRYQLSNQNESSAFREYVTDRGGVFLYRSRYCLPLGFMVNETTQAEANLTSGNPFEVQNDFLDAAKGVPPIFKIGQKQEGDVIDYSVREDGHLYFYVDKKIKNLTIREKGGEGKSTTFTNLECPMIVYAGEVSAGQHLEISFTDEKEEIIGITDAMLDEKALSDAINALSEEPMKVVRFTDTFLEGEVETLKSGTLFTSIPYDKGWDVFVDGEKTEVGDFYGAFIQIPLSAGTHRIEFRYHVPGLLTGAILSVLALAGFVLLQILKKRVSQKERFF